MSDTPAWASDFDSCALQCLDDAINAAGCADLSDTACFCKEDALLAMTLSDSLFLCLGLTCDPYLVGSKSRGQPLAVPPTDPSKLEIFGS